MMIILFNDSRNKTTLKILQGSIRAAHSLEFRLKDLTLFIKSLTKSRKLNLNQFTHLPKLTLKLTQFQELVTQWATEFKVIVHLEDDSFSDFDTSTLDLDAEMQASKHHFHESNLWQIPTTSQSTSSNGLITNLQDENENLNAGTGDLDFFDFGVAPGSKPEDYLNNFVATFYEKPNEPDSDQTETIVISFNKQS